MGFMGGVWCGVGLGWVGLGWMDGVGRGRVGWSGVGCGRIG